MRARRSLFEPAEGSLGRAVGWGAVTTGGAQAVRLGCQIASVIVLSRLLPPEQFGIVAMAAPVLAFVGLFQDLGLVEATIQRKTITHAEVNLLFWINMFISVVLSGLMIAVAPLIAGFYGQPAAGVLLAATSVNMVVGSATSQHYAILARRMEFGWTAVIDSVAAVAGLGTAIVWALFDPTFWALYAGALATAVCGCSGMWLLSGWRPGLPRWIPEASGLVRFGAGLTGFNFANFFTRNLDNVLIGRYWGVGELGFYDRAYKLLLFPLQQITNPLARVMVPALSRLNEEPERYRHAFVRVIRMVLMVTLPGVAVGIALSDVLIPFALGEEWAESARIFQALGFAGLMQPLNNPVGWLFISQGRSTEFMRWGIFTAVTSVAAFSIGLPYGATGVAAAYAVSEYLRTPLLWSYLGRSGPVQADHVLRAALPWMAGSHVVVALLWAARSLLPDTALPALLLATAGAYVGTCAVAALFPAGREALRDAGMLVARLANPRQAPRGAASAQA